MMKDLYIKNKRILLFDFDGTLVETISGGLYAKDLTDMKIKQDVVNRALDLMEQNGVKYFGIISNQCDVGVGFVSDEDIDAKINYVLRCVHDLAVKRGIRGVVYGHYECFSIDEYDPMMKPNPGMVYKALGACRLMMDGITYKDIETMTLMVGSASGLPGQFSDSDKVCAEKAGVEYMDVITFVGKDLDLNYVLSKEHTSEGIVILNNDHIYILENPYGVGLNIKITLKDFYKIETDDGKTATVDDVLNIRIDKDQNFNSYSDVIKIETLKDGSIKYTSLYHKSKKKTAIVYHKSDLDGVVSAAIATMYENSKNKDVIYIPYSYEDDVKKVTSKVSDLDVVYVLDVSFGVDSKTVFKKWLDEGKSLMWIDHHKGIIEDSKTWGFVVPGLRRVGVGACALASDLLMGKVPAIVRCLSDYDVWNKESELGWDTVVAIQYALRSKIRLNVLIALSYLYDHFKEDMKDNEIDLIFYDLAKEGRAIINYMAGKNEQEVGAYSFEAYVDEVKVVAMNTAESGSKVFDSLTPDWLDGRKIKALMPFCIMPGGKVRFSLYKCVEDGVDCCEVSKKFGGGGHAGAAGFVLDVSSDQFKDFLENHKLTSIQ